MDLRDALRLLMFSSAADKTYHLVGATDLKLTVLHEGSNTPIPSDEDLTLYCGPPEDLTKHKKNDPSQIVDKFFKTKIGEDGLPICLNVKNEVTVFASHPSHGFGKQKIQIDNSNSIRGGVKDAVITLGGAKSRRALAHGRDLQTSYHFSESGSIPYPLNEGIDPVGTIEVPVADNCVIEDIDVELFIEHDYAGNPAHVATLHHGSESVELADTPEDTCPCRNDGSCYCDYNFDSFTGFEGEMAVGDWTLDIDNIEPDNCGSSIDWKLNIICAYDISKSGSITYPKPSPLEDGQISPNRDPVSSIGTIEFLPSEAEDCIIEDVDVQLYINHGYGDSAHVVTLTSGSTSVELADIPNNSCPCNDDCECICDHNFNSFGGFNGQTPVGEWTLDLFMSPDNCGQSIGWTINIKCATSTGPLCFPTYSPGKTYFKGDWVSATVDSSKYNFQCSSDFWCSNVGYAPGGVYSSEAWSMENFECSGYMPQPALEPWEGGGCPKSFAAGTDYFPGDVVSSGDTVYECNPEPNNLFCGMTVFEPRKSGHWTLAWTELGSCSGTIMPTSSPAYDLLENMGGCPNEWMQGERYDQGDRISFNRLLFSCKASDQAQCGQAGFGPSDSIDHWRQAWNVVGHCSGSMNPTVSPSFDPESIIGGCPDEWSTGTGYEEGDAVSVTVSYEPERIVVFRCKLWPSSNYCRQFDPDHPTGGLLGWEYAGPCSGSIGPTSSPVFTSLSMVGEGCPLDHVAGMAYEPKDQVSRVVSTDPERKVAYACRSWPMSEYCKMSEATFAPGEESGLLGWILVGSCDGTMVPTASPVEYQGICQYSKCTMTEQDTTCEIKDVEPYSTSNSYDAGDVVRIDNQRFVCKEGLTSPWCKEDAYKPEIEGNGIWTQAWSRDGLCS